MLPTISWRFCMKTSSKGNIFRVTGLLCGEFTGHRWIPRTKASDAELWYFLWSAPWIKNREAGDLKRHRAHYDVIVLGKPCMAPDNRIELMFNGFRPEGTRPLPETMLTQICQHMASLGPNESTFFVLSFVSGVSMGSHFILFSPMKAGMWLQYFCDSSSVKHYCLLIRAIISIMWSGLLFYIKSSKLATPVPLNEQNTFRNSKLTLSLSRTHCHIPSGRCLFDVDPMVSAIWAPV